jgi:membrane fusion protein, multidrug efflux system
MKNFAITIAALAGVAAAACSKPQVEHVAIVPVQVEPVTRITAPFSIGANGVVEPLQTVDVEAQVGGTVLSVDFHEGDQVAVGQELFRLDPAPFKASLRQAQGTLARDSAQWVSAQRDAERYKALAAKDYVTKSQADQAEAAAEALGATLQADRATVDNARINVGYTTIRAPIAGRTGRLLVRQGNLVRPNADVMVVINQIRPILVRFPILQKDFLGVQRRLGAGPVQVRVTTADSGRVPEPGQLAFLDNNVDSLTGTVTAKARFENQTDALWPGEYVQVSMELAVDSNATAIPSRAVMAGQDGNYVFVIGRTDTAEVRSVAVGREVGTMTTIANGLTPGERVVVDGQSRLASGSKVSVKQAAAPRSATTASADGASKGVTP